MKPPHRRPEGNRQNDRSALLKKMLLELKQKSSLIGDVRGEGLFLGIEISDFENNQAPLPAIANKIINEMRAKCILLSVDGLKKNIIKIKPPLPFNKENADFLVGNLEKVIFSF